MSRGLQDDGLEPWELLSMDYPPTDYSSQKLIEMRPDPNYQYGQRNRSADELSKFGRYNAPQPHTFFRDQYTSSSSDSGGYSRTRFDCPPYMQQGIRNPKIRKSSAGLPFPLSNPVDYGQHLPPVLDSYNQYQAAGSRGQGHPRQHSNPEHMNNRNFMPRDQRSVTNPETNDMFARPRYPDRGYSNQLQKKYPPTTTSPAFKNNSGYGKRAPSPQIPSSPTPRSQSPFLCQRSSSVPLEKVMMGGSMCSIEPGPVAQNLFPGPRNSERTSSELAAYAKVQDYQKFERHPRIVPNKTQQNLITNNMSFDPSKVTNQARYNWKPRSIGGQSTRPNSEIDMFPVPVVPPQPKEPAIARDPEFNFSNLPVLTLTNPLDKTSEDKCYKAITCSPPQGLGDQDAARLTPTIPLTNNHNNPKRTQSTDSKPSTTSRLSSSFNAVRKSIQSRTHSISSNTKDRLSSKKTSSEGHSQVADVNIGAEDSLIDEANQIPTLDLSPEISPDRNSIGLAISGLTDQPITDLHSRKSFADDRAVTGNVQSDNVSTTIRMVSLPARVASVKSNKSAPKSAPDILQPSSPQQPERPISSQLTDIVWYKDSELMEPVKGEPINANFIFRKPHSKRSERLKQSYHVTKRTMQARYSLKKKMIKAKWQTFQQERAKVLLSQQYEKEKARNLCARIARRLSMVVWTLRACNPKYGDKSSI